jgi:ATP-dependent DNA helicase RecQ
MSEIEDNYTKCVQILNKYWGHKNFRPLQWDIIESVLNKKDTIALLPTGGGKSVCFQVPALAIDGMCIVVTPLIALMKDQVMQLNNKGINATAIHSGMKRREIDIAIGNSIQLKHKFLYLSPERLQTEMLLAKIHLMNVGLIAVDEAHCISQWGYDFRPAYLKISTLTELVPEVPIIALTATATAKVVVDMGDKLLLQKPAFFQKSFERKNIAYMVLQEENKMGRMLKIARTIKGSGIVYVRNRRLTQEISHFFNQNGIISSFYHAGLTTDQRDARQHEWISNQTQIMVCTNAFGMGIDKPDVRFVIHYSAPDCIENYFQEAGRAGRDEEKAYAVLLYEKSDRFDLESQVEASFPPMHEIKRVYQGLSNFFQVAVGVAPEKSFDFDINEFCSTYNLRAGMVFNAMKLLERDGIIALTEEINMPSRIKFLVNKNALYDFQVYHFKYDEFIKLLLRSYGGIFDNYVNINETELARRGRLKKEEVVDYLKKLDGFKILNYLPQKSIPQLHFTALRKDAKSIHLSNEVYVDRKIQALKKMEAMLNYAESANVCRNLLLLQYFEENNAQKCGHCDVCILEKKAALSNLEVQKMSEKIIGIIQKEPLTVVQLIENFKQFKEDEAFEVLHWLQEINQVEEREGLLYINTKVE